MAYFVTRRICQMHVSALCILFLSFFGHLVIKGKWEKKELYFLTKNTQQKDTYSLVGNEYSPSKDKLVGLPLKCCNQTSCFYKPFPPDFTIVNFS